MWSAICLRCFIEEVTSELVLDELLFSRSVLSNFVTPWTVARQASLSFTIGRSLLKLMSIELVMPSNHLTICHPLVLLPSIFGWVAWPNLEIEERHSRPGVQYKKRYHSLYMNLDGFLAWWEESEGQILEGLYILCEVKLQEVGGSPESVNQRMEGHSLPPLPRQSVLCLCPAAPQKLAGRAKSVDSWPLISS